MPHVLNLFAETSSMQEISDLELFGISCQVLKSQQWDEGISMEKIVCSHYWRYSWKNPFSHDVSHIIHGLTVGQGGIKEPDSKNNGKFIVNCWFWWNPEISHLFHTRNSTGMYRFCCCWLCKENPFFWLVFVLKLPQVGVSCHTNYLQFCIPGIQQKNNAVLAKYTGFHPKSTGDTLL